MNLDVLIKRLDYRFTHGQLLQQALTHRSHGFPHNERLEFLGDSVLNCVIAHRLYRDFPKISEGDLSRVRAHLVNKHSLHDVALSLSIGDFIRLGEGELKSGGFRRPSILADAVEAVFGAIFLDGGFIEADRVINALYTPFFSDLDPRRLGKDPKTLLQEYLQSKRLPLPRYEVIATEGEAHDQRFEVECVIPEVGVQTRGEGTSRRSAEQAAAQRAYEMINPA